MAADVDSPFAVDIVQSGVGEVIAPQKQAPASDDAKVARLKLDAVLEISAALAAATSVEEILPGVLNTLMTRVFKIAHRGSIMLLDPTTGTMIPTAQQHAGDVGDGTVRLSTTVLDHVLKQKTGVRSIDAGADERFQMSRSIALTEMRSMMCVPMLNLKNEVIGIIHVDSLSTFAQFNEEDMELLVAIAGQAALAYDSACQMLKQEQMRSEMELARHRALSQMVSGLAHELNTPLGIICQAASAISDSAKEIRRARRRSDNSR